ncbi:hypothetical protein FoTM2_004431 [Fusarium oxysporum f. sp. vasinfectum]|nr:hypothetical protein FoTM2_004431 [Fusarium oxysporum f. sp. vasinfectum]
MPSLTEHAISLPDTPLDSILYDAKETDFGSYAEICHSYNQIWRSTDGEMDVIRLPYVDSYPRAPYHINTSTSKGKRSWIPNGSNWPEKEKIVIGPPPMGEIMGLGPHDFDDFDRSTPTQEVQYPVVGSPVATTSEVPSEDTLSGSTHLSQDHSLSFSPLTSERADDSTSFASTLVDSSHLSSSPTTIHLALPTESLYSTEIVEVPSSPIPHPSLPTQISRDSPSVRTSDIFISTPGSSQELGQTHSGSTLEVVSTFKNLPTISPFPGNTLTSPLTEGDTTATPNGSTRDFSTALDNTSSNAQASQEGTSKKLPAETSNFRFHRDRHLRSHWHRGLLCHNSGYPCNRSDSSSDQISTNEETISFERTTTFSIVTSPINTLILSTKVASAVESSVISTDFLTPTETVPKGSFTNMDSSSPSTPAIDTQASGST